MAAARMRSAETSQWAARVAPPSAYGGVAVRYDAIEALLQVRRSRGIAVATLDYTRAFDYAHPQMCVEAMTLLG